MMNYILLFILWIGYELDGPGFECQQWQDIYSVIQNIQTGSGAHTASYSLDTGVSPSPPGVKRPGREAIHSPPPNAKVKNKWSYTSAPPICLHSMNSDNFTLSC